MLDCSTLIRALNDGTVSCSSSPAGPGSSAMQPPSTPATPAVPVVPFAQRADSGKVLETLNDHLPGVEAVAGASGSTSRVKLSSTRHLTDYKYRIAYERAMERSEGESQAGTS